jgi:hypothetical protein
MPTPRGLVGGALRQRQFAAKDAARGAYEVAAATRLHALLQINLARFLRARRRGNARKSEGIARLINRMNADGGLPYSIEIRTRQIREAA